LAVKQYAVTEIWAINRRWRSKFSCNRWLVFYSAENKSNWKFIQL